MFPVQNPSPDPRAGPGSQLPLPFIDGMVSRLTEQLREELHRLNAPPRLDELVCSLSFFAYYGAEARDRSVSPMLQADLLPELGRALTRLHEPGGAFND